jgi:hypothetical protein
MLLFIKMKISFSRFALARQNDCIIFFHTSGILAKCAILFFLMVANCATFQKTEKKPCILGLHFAGGILTNMYPKFIIEVLVQVKSCDKPFWK